MHPLLHGTSLAQTQAQGPSTNSASVDPTEFCAPPLEDPTLHVDSNIPTHILTLVTYVDGNQASPTRIATFTLHCWGFCIKVTCPVLDLVDEPDVILSHEWCQEHKVVVGCKDEHATVVYKGRPHVLPFDDCHSQTCAPSSSLCSIG